MTNVAAATQDWQDVVDIAALARWMNGQSLGSGPIEALAAIGGGTQNILLRFTRDGREYVFRRPPRHPRPDSDDAMRREIRVLAALGGSTVPHPRFVAGCGDPAVLGYAFYLMDPIDGFNASVAMPSPHADDPALRRRMGEAMVDGIIALARIDIDAVGLADFGKLEGWLERQVSRWRRQLDGYAQFDGWGGLASLPDIDRICAWLEANRPAVIRPGLIHGDYHFANVLFRRDAPELAAVVDWELASIGDPLLDLGGLIATWPDETGDTILPISPADGLPPVDAIVARYLEATGRDAADARWFGVLACFRLGALLEGTHARAGANLAPKETGDRLHTHAITLFNRALRLVAD